MDTGHVQAHAGPGDRRQIGLPVALRDNLPAVASYGGPLLLVLYLALAGGGYDQIVWGEVGVAVWWIATLGLAVAVLPVARLTSVGLIALGLLVALSAWAALGISGSESSERTMTEVARLTSYGGVLALALLAQGRDCLRRFACGIGTAIAVVAVLALLSRLHPQWFSDAQRGGLLPQTAYRLSYPLDYWNGLAALIAMGIPLMLWIAASARTIAGRSFALAAVPAMTLAAFYTFSRGGVAEIAIGCTALIALYPRRLSLLPSFAVAALGSAILIVAATQRDALADGATSAVAADQASSMLLTTLVVCAGVALVGAALAHASFAGVGPRLNLSRRTTLTAVAVAALAGVALIFATGLPGKAADGWQEFKSGPSPGGVAEQRFDSASGNGRYQYWESALDASSAAPVTGIGAGTFEFWWARNGSSGGFVRDAHSLYVETLAELGFVGLALLLALFGVIAVTGASRALRHGSSDRRAAAAAVTAAFVAFAAAAAIDWAWELAVLPVTAMLLGAAILGPSAKRRHGSQSRFRRNQLGIASRIGASAAAAIALLIVILPLAGASAIRTSQVDAEAGRLGEALTAAENASAAQPYAATPQLQTALLYEQTGSLEPALAAARQATESESTNWRTWLVLSRLEARAGHPERSVAAFERARGLNPRSPLLR